MKLAFWRKKNEVRVGFPWRLAIVDRYAQPWRAFEIWKKGEGLKSLDDPWIPVQSLGLEMGSLRGGTPVTTVVFDMTITIPIHEAVLFSAPYIRVFRIPKWFRRGFEEARFVFLVDGEEVLRDVRAGSHSSVPLDRLLAVSPFEFSKNSLFIAKTFDGNGVVQGQGPTLGLFLPNGTHLQGKLEGVPTGAGTVGIETGCVMMRYSTRQPQFRFGPKDWSPRMTVKKMECPS